MAAIITDIIPIQNFEIVLNKLGVILLEELTNQIDLQNLDNELGIFISRQEPYGKEEDVMINITLDNSNYSGKTQKDRQGLTTYYVDVFCQGIESENQTGSTSSRITLMQYVGMIGFILSSTKYKTLGFENNLIGGTMVDSIQVQNNYGNQDANFISFARITFSARLQEVQDTWTGIELLGNDTNIKIDTTNKGYKLIFNS